MYYECCVCKSSRQDAILHHFPCTEKRLNMWLKCLNRDDLNKLSPEQLSKLFVCQRHFEKKFLTSKSRLIGKAYPSLFTEDEILNGVPSQENAENMDPQTEHSYSRKRHFDHTYAQLEPLKEIVASGSIEFQNLPGPSSHNPTTRQNPEIVASGSIEFQNLPGPSSHNPPTRRNPEIIASASIEFQNLPGLSHNPSSRQNPGLEKPSRKRLIHKLKDLTPTCQLIYKEFKKAKQQANFYRRAKRALKFSKEKSFEKLTENMNPYAKRIMKMQINLCTKKKKGRRFNNNNNNN